MPAINRSGSILASLLWTLGQQATAEAATAPTSPTVTASEISAHTTFLADDLLGGREAGTRGYDIAAAYVAAQFASYGLEPAPGSEDFYQRVPLRRRSLQTDGVYFEILTKRGTMEFKNGEHIAVDASPFARDEVIDAGLVFVGWGISLHYS